MPCHKKRLFVFSVYFSVPCKARLVKANMDGYTNTAQVSWNPSDGGLMYKVLAKTASGHNVTCKTNMTSCDLEGLLCGQSYAVSVRSMGETCSSIINMSGALITGEPQRNKSARAPGVLTNMTK